jgi:hypothetical protein
MTEFNFNQAFILLNQFFSKKIMDDEKYLKEKKENETLFNQIIQLLGRKQQPQALNDELTKIANQNNFESPRQLLNQVVNSAGESPLVVMIQDQIFNNVIQLINLGVTVGSDEKAAFEVSLDSDNADKSGLTSIKKQEVSGDARLHPMKHFGLVLGIKGQSPSDGTSTGYAHMGPSHRMMTECIEKFTKKNPDNQAFQEVADAFSFTDKASQFIQSTPKNIPKVGVAITQRIQEGAVTEIPISCKGHAMGMTIVPDSPGSNTGYLVLTDRGKKSQGGTQIYCVDNLKKIDATFVNELMCGHRNGLSHEDVRQKIQNVVSHQKPIYTVEQSMQKRDNCTIANTRSNVEGVLLCIKARDKKGFEHVTEQDVTDNKIAYKKFNHDTKLDKVNELVSAITNNPNNEDVTYLAKSYLDQHPNGSPSLTEPLKQVLEKMNKGELNKDVSNDKTFDLNF